MIEMCRSCSAGPVPQPSSNELGVRYRLKVCAGAGSARVTPSRHYGLVIVWLVWPVGHQDIRVRDRLRLFPDYGAETPVWSRDGMVSFSRLKISDALRADLISWRTRRSTAQTSAPRATRTSGKRRAGCLRLV